MATTKSIDGEFTQDPLFESMGESLTDIAANTAEVSSNITTYGESVVVTNTPIFNGAFLYDVIHEQLYNSFTGFGGGFTVSDSMLTTSISNTLGSYAVLRSNVIVKYFPGTTNVIRFTHIFDTPSALTTQRIGLGSAGSELSLGFDGLSFGVLRAHSGKIQHVKFLITTAAGGVENATITLNGTVYTVALTDASGDRSFTAWEVTQDNTILLLWDMRVVGDDVLFTFRGVGEKSGVYSFTSATAAATPTTHTVGDDLVSAWVPSDSFNGDTTQFAILDFTKGNVFQIKFSWLGFNQISYEFLSPTTGKMVSMHTIRYQNTALTPSVLIPNMPMQITCASLGGTTALSMKTVSVACFTQAILPLIVAPRYSVDNEVNISSGVETNILALGVRYTTNSIVTQSRIILNSISIVVDGTKPVLCKLYLNADLGAGSVSDFPTWSYVSANGLAICSKNSTTHTNGIVEDEFFLAKTGQIRIKYEQPVLSLNRGETFTITALSSGGSTIDVSLSWVDDL